MISVWTDGLNRKKIMRIKYWNIVISYNHFTCIFPIIAYFLLIDIFLCYSLNKTIVTVCFQLSIFCTILYCLKKYGLKGSQLLHASRDVWWCVQQNWENDSKLNQTVPK